mmetsp:Transcript_19149/g.56931  ORF Transcript_19149/g.56931 Transcript_19149/m.56931 type:complete len:787 (+) Transcript_19149:41-2401(+)
MAVWALLLLLGGVSAESDGKDGYHDLGDLTWLGGLFPYVDEFTGHEICFNRDFGCVEHACPNAPDGCVLLSPTDSRVPLEVDLYYQCCPVSCYAINETTAEPCMSTGQLPHKPDDVIDSEFPIEYPPEIDVVTGYEICFHQDEQCPVVTECPAPPDGCSVAGAVEASRPHLEVAPFLGLCCPLPCVTVTDADGKLCSWVEHFGNGLFHPIVIGDGTVNFIDENSDGKLCFEESTAPSDCPAHNCSAPPIGCTVLPVDQAPLEMVEGDNKCCKRECVFVDEHGKECGVQGPRNDTAGTALPTTFVPGANISVDMCFEESADCPPAHCPTSSRRMRRAHTAAFGCHFLGGEEVPMVVQPDGKCCKMPCVAVDAEGKTCADNKENATQIANSTQVEVCFEASPNCQPAICGVAPNGCTFLAAALSPLVKMMNGSCCPEPCIAINMTTGGKCGKAESLPWVKDPEPNSTEFITINTREIRLCHMQAATCPTAASPCPAAPNGCRSLNASLLIVNAAGTCCPLGCAVVDDSGKQCKVEAVHEAGLMCTTQSSQCPTARCMSIPGCRFDPAPSLVYDDAGECCPERLCPYVQDNTSNFECDHDPEYVLRHQSNGTEPTASSNQSTEASSRLTTPVSTDSQSSSAPQDLSTSSTSSTTSTEAPHRAVQSTEPADGIPESNAQGEGSSRRESQLAMMGIIVGVLGGLTLVGLVLFTSCRSKRDGYNQKLTNQLVDVDANGRIRGHANPMYNCTDSDGRPVFQSPVSMGEEEVVLFNHAAVRPGVWSATESTSLA